MRWLTPGIKVKRWLLLAVAGGALFLNGFGRLIGSSPFLNFHVNEYVNRQLIGRDMISPVTIEWVFMIAGLFAVYFGIRAWMRSIVAAVSPRDEQRLVDVVYERRHLARGYRIVAIGGGTGLSTLLRGLKDYTANLTAIVTVADDGGSSGRLRHELGVLPPGDIRNCLVALADNESTMAELFQYRFNEGDGLSGHSFGNLFLAAMCGIAGDFDSAIKESSRVLAIRGRVLPSTLSNVALEATLGDGSIVRGESAISQSTAPILSVSLIPENCEPLDEAIEAILAADAIILGPGSLYTSVMPNLLVPGIAQAIEQSMAFKIYVCNIMTQPGETDGMTAADHVRALLRGTNRQVFDYVLVNVEQPHRLLKRYESERAFQVRPDVKAVSAMGVTPIYGKFVSETQLVRHDANKLAQSLMKLIIDKLEGRGVMADVPQIVGGQASAR
ncbi:MAG: YvcK family protein [Candidatus Eremiobacteraeota bacterium]|nr:YvcK family protein [Candidatus Eremiobacteraeota bacterium]